MWTFSDVFTVVAAPAFASFGMLMGDRWKPETPLAAYMRDIAVRPSTCDGCTRAVPPIYLIPFFGWLFARGRCACRSQKLTPLYFVVEALGLLFALAAVHLYGDRAWTFLPAIAGVAAAARSDYHTREVHESAWALIWLSAGLFIWQTPHSLAYLATPALFIGLFLPIAWLYKRAGRIPVIPFGDVFLLIGLTAFLDIDRAIVFAVLLIPAILFVAVCPKGGQPFLPKAPALVYAAALSILLPQHVLASATGLIDRLLP